MGPIGDKELLLPEPGVTVGLLVHDTEEEKHKSA